MTQNKEKKRAFASILTKSGRRKLSVTCKIMYYFIAFMCITLVLLWLCQIVFFDRIYKSITIKEIESHAAIIISNENSPNFSSSSKAIIEKSSSCIAVYSDTNKSTHSLSDVSYDGCYLYHLQINQIIELYEKAKDEGGEILYTFAYNEKDHSFTGVPFSASSSDENHSVIYVKLFTSHNGESCAVFINRVISPVGATKTTILYILIVLSLIYLAMAIIILLITSKNIAKPLSNINEAAKELEKGNYNVKYAQKAGYREIDELAHTLESASAELSKVETLQRELIANVSHDLRTPLTLISGYSEIMRDIPGEATKENCQIIIDEVAKLSSLVNDMLEISKLQSGTFEPKKEELPLNVLLIECIDGYRELISAQGYDLTFENRGDFNINADRTMIFQALRNLINNALTYTGDDKSVKVCAESISEGFVRISVSDTGNGIPPEQLKNIWDRYYRDPEHKRSANGTGLGLSIVKSVIKMHGGRYGVRSKVGVGSTFWIELPIKE